MGSFDISEVDNYGGQGGAGYFSLKNDKDVARVRIMYASAADVKGYATHEIELNGKKRHVNCLRKYNEPVEKCPFCREKRFQQAKLFVPLYDIDTERVYVWERGKKFFSKISSLCARYDNLVSHIFEIERNGKPGSTQTTYEIYEVEHDDTTLEDLPELPQILGSVVLEKSAEEMEYYLENGEFPDVEDEPVRRRNKRDDEDEVPFRGSRRTPNNRERF